MTKSPILNDIRIGTEAAKISVKPVQFPMVYVGKNDGERPRFSFANGVEYQVAELGAGYLSERFKQNKYAACTKLYRDELFADLAGLTSQADDQTYQAAFYDDAIVGIMSNYNPVPHVELLDLVESSGLADQIAWWNLHPTGLEIGIRINAVATKSGLMAALRIENGHSGHYALKYGATVRVNDYEWTAPLGGKRRHLSKVQLAVSQLTAAMEQVSDMKMEDRLKVMTISEALAIIVKEVDQTVRQERLLMTVMDTKPTNASELVATLGVYASTVGYSAAVHGLLDPVLEAAAGR